jgi:hypothetical protein
MDPMGLVIELWVKMWLANINELEVARKKINKLNKYFDILGAI